MNVNFDDPVKQEVWNALRALNDAWTKGNPNNLKNYFHKDMVAITATDRERLEGKEACFTSWNNFAKAAKIHHWNELEPRIQIYGNTAVVTYYFDMSFDMGGQAVKLGGRDMFVFVNEGGKWLAVADQFSAYPAT